MTTEHVTHAEHGLALDRIAAARRTSWPFTWAFVENTFGADALAHLVSECPQHAFVRVERGGDKTYRTACRTLMAQNAPALSADDLTPRWRALCEALRGAAYRESIERVSGEALADTCVEVVLWRYDAGSWLAPHVDKESKRVTHVIYLNPGWEPPWGGQLEIRTGEQGERVVTRVEPRAGASVVLVRGETSWHAVAPITQLAGDRERYSIQVVFHRKETHEDARRSARG
ncbi:MAG: 2OG-Fe(II) oxygenase [Kofleriaceae bacterium]